MRIDGRLDETAWQAAVPADEFVQFDPHEGQPASERTEARVLVDDAAIYVGIRMFDREPAKIQANLARRDEFMQGDQITVSFDSYHDHLTAFVFRLSALGARRDAMNLGGGWMDQDNSWDAVWESGTSMDSLGWSAEYRIPLSQLRYDPRLPDQSWGIQIEREIPRKGEISVFSFTPKSAQQGVNRFGHLAGLGQLPSPSHLELVPYVLAKNDHPDAPPGDPLRRRNEVAPGAGLDVKYGITSNLTLNATFNPDFGQVEVDPAVVNLTALETFYPERRPFFVEGANTFRFGTMRSQNSSNGYEFVHTRRIGRAPQRFAGGPGIAFVDAPFETTIAGAAKVTGRARGGWSVGMLDAYTMREEARLRMATLTDSSVTVEPAANYFVGRVKREFRGGNTTLGFAATAVNRFLDDPSLDPLFRSAAYVGGFDWNHAWHDRTWAFDGSIVFSDNIGSAQAIDALQTSPTRYLQRPDRRRFRRDSTRGSLTGYVAELTFAKASGKHWIGTLTYQDYNPGFDVNEVGFLGTTDLRSIAPLIGYQENQPGRYLREWGQFLFWNPAWNYDGDLQYNGVGAITMFETKNFWEYELRLDWKPPALDDRLTRGGPMAGLASGGDVSIELRSDRRKRYSFGVDGSYAFNGAGGSGRNVGLELNIRPSGALRVQLEPSYARTHAMGQFVATVGDANATDTYGARYIFATLDRHEVSFETRVDWTFTPVLSLQLFAQPLLSAGDFFDYKELARARAFEFEVYGRDAGTISRAASGTYSLDPDAGGPSPSFTFRDRDFNSRFLRGNAVLRWEYRPGSALFVVWQQSRSGFTPSGEFEFGRDFGDLWATRPVNQFVVKGTWWISR